MRTYISVYQILRDLVVNFSTILDELLGGNFFKSVQYSFSDYVFTLKKYLQNPSSSSDTKLFVVVSDLRPYEQFNYLSRLQLLPFQYFDRQILCVNETKGQYFETANQLFQIDFTVRIITDSNLRAAEIKHYMMNIFPPNTYQIFPGPDHKLTSFIPLYDNSYISDWDLVNDKIFYIYKSTDVFKGNNVIFLPYEYQPILYTTSIEKSSNRSLIEREKYAASEINLSFIISLPVYMYLVSNVNVKEIKLGIRDIWRSHYITAIASTYTPQQILEDYEDKLSEYIISSLITHRDIISEDDDYLVVKSSLGINLDYQRVTVFVPEGDKLYSNISQQPELIVEKPTIQSGTAHIIKINKNLVTPQLIELFKLGDIRLDLHYFYSK